MMLNNQDLPLVTVGMVTYNSCKYVHDAISSVLNSSYANFELIICDDRSTDNTWEILQSFYDQRICTYLNEQNLGEYPNRNQIIDLAKGEYLIFIDGDDMIYPHGLEFMVKMIHAFPNCAMAQTAWYRNYIFYPAVLSPRQFYLTHFAGRSFIRTSFAGVIFNVSKLKEVGGLSNIHPNGDDFIRLKIANKFDTLLINDALSWWRETPGQATEKLKKNIENFIKMQQMYDYLLLDESCPLNGKEVEAAFQNLMLSRCNFIRYKLKKGKIKDAFILMKTFDISMLNLIFTPKFINLDPLNKYHAGNPYKINSDYKPFTIISTS